MRAIAYPPTDVRSGTPALFQATRLSSLVRRLASILALAAIDVFGLAAGLFAALVLRELYYGRSVRWHPLWDSAWNWLRWMWNGWVSGLRLITFHKCQDPWVAIAMAVSLNRLPTVT